MLGRQLLFVTATLLTVEWTAWGQKSPDWRVYKLADGFPESACLSVTISSQGKVLVRHLNQAFVSELDGYRISSKPLPPVGKGRVYQSPGGQLWTVVPEGLCEFKDGSWMLHPVPEIAAEPRVSTVIDPVPLCPIKQGLVVFLLPDRLVEFSSGGAEPPHTEVLRSVNQTGLRRFAGMVPARDGGLWVAGARGLAKIPGPLRNLKPETEWHEHLVPEAVGITNLQAPHEMLRSDAPDNQQEGIITMAESSTNRQKVLACFDGQTWTVETLPAGKPRQVWLGPDHTRWAMTIDSLYEWEEGAHAEASENEEISARQYFDVAVEPGGNFWLATSDGLFRYSPLLWRTPAAVRKINSLVRCLAGDPEGRLWFVAGSRIYTVQKGQLRASALPMAGNLSLPVRSLHCLRNRVAVLETEEPESSAGNQIFTIDPETAAVRPLPNVGPATRLQVLGLFADGSLCLLSEAQGGFTNFFVRFDGHDLQPVPDLPPLPTIGTNLHSLFVARNGDVWVSSDGGTACYRDKSWHTFASSDKSTPEASIGFIELADGKIWCADQDQVWEFDGRSWSVFRRGFDRINALLRTRDGSIWVACNNGLQRFVQGTWIENSVEEGLPSSTVRELYEDQRGLWAATTRGLTLFHPQADRDPPAVSIQQLATPGNGPPEGSVITLAFIGEDKWRCTPAARLLFSYRLDDHEWTAYQEIPHVTLTDLPAGKHTIKVRALDRNGNKTKDPPAQLDFAIILPWYKETRLVLISCAGLVAALFFATLAFNRHRQLVLSYAEVEKKVAERTQQLEMANDELLQSQKMRALGTLAAGIAHDFNNILSIVKGSAQIIEDNLDNPDKIRSRADRIRTVVDQGAGIVRAMLGFSRDSGQEAAPCEVNAVIDDTLKLLGDRFLREVQVKYQPTSGLPTVLASKDFVQQILLNFIFNAAESMTTNKEILLRSQLWNKLPQDLVLLPTQASAYVAVSVQDFGCGIPAQILLRIFEPFFTTKALSSRRGTGLGLSMAYELAKKLGAGLCVESVVDQGSTFTLILPVKPLSPQPSAFS